MKKVPFVRTYLISFHFQLTLLVKLGIPQANSAELQVTGKDLFVLRGELRLSAELVDDLSDPDDVAVAILDRHTQQRSRSVPRKRVDLAIKPRILNETRAIPFDHHRSVRPTLLDKEIRVVGLI